MIRKLTVAALVIAATTATARAEVIDMANLTCGELTSTSAENAGTMLMWLHGYYGGKAGDTTMDTKGFEEAAKAIGEFCAANPNAKVIEELDKVEAAN